MWWVLKRSGRNLKFLNHIETWGKMHEPQAMTITLKCKSHQLCVSATFCKFGGRRMPNFWWLQNNFSLGPKMAFHSWILSYLWRIRMDQIRIDIMLWCAKTGRKLTESSKGHPFSNGFPAFGFRRLTINKSSLHNQNLDIPTANSHLQLSAAFQWQKDAKRLVTNNFGTLLGTLQLCRKMLPKRSQTSF